MVYSFNACNVRHPMRLVVLHALPIPPSTKRKTKEKTTCSLVHQTLSRSRARYGIRLPFMLLDDQLSWYVTKPQATNTISLIVILMCHTECLATDLTFHSYSTCFLSVLVSCSHASSTYLPTSLRKRTLSPRDSRVEVKHRV